MPQEHENESLDKLLNDAYGADAHSASDETSVESSDPASGIAAQEPEIVDGLDSSSNPIATVDDAVELINSVETMKEIVQTQNKRIELLEQEIEILRKYIVR